MVADLINRSLVLGTIDRPSVHDLVLDLSVAQYNADGLRLNHRRIVEAFRAARPADAHGRCKFDVAQKDNPVSVYACHEIQSHLEQGWQANKLSDELATSDWLADFPQDAIVVAAGRVLGPEQVTKLAESAEAAKDWWRAARYWAIVQSVMPVASVGSGESRQIGPTVKALDAMAALGRISESETDKEDLELAQVAALAATWDAGGDLGRRPELVERVLSSKAAMRDPVSVGAISVTLKTVPAMNSYDDSCCTHTLATVMTLLRAAESDPDPVARSKCLAMAYNFSQISLPYLHPDFSWDAVYGVGGETLIAAFDDWDVEDMHSFLARTLSLDIFLCFATPCLSLALHWGDMSTVYANLDRSMVSISGLIADNDMEEFTGILCGSIVWQTFVWSCRMPADRCQAVGNVFASAGLTWSGAAEVVDNAAAELVFVRERGNKDTDGISHPAEMLLGMIQCCYILMTSNPHVTDDEIMLALPGVEEIIELSVRATNGAHDNGLCKLGCYLHHSHVLMNWFLNCAAVAAKLGRHNEVLGYAVAGLMPDVEKSGTTIPLTRVLLMTLQANALAALGRKGEAGVIFEAAADEAHRAGFFLYEAFTLRDLKANVLDELGHGDWASRRVGAALRLLTGGPADLLTELLGGLDAAELLAMPPPDANYRIDAYATEDSATAALRQELGGLRLKELRKRANSSGVSVDELEDATDSDDPKVTLIDLLVELAALPPAKLVNTVATLPEGTPPPRREIQMKEESGLAALRAELQGLRMTALQKLAVDRSIDQEKIDLAVDSDQPKAQLISLLLVQHKAANDRAEPEQSDFEYLRRFYQANKKGLTASSEWGVDAWTEEDWAAKYTKILSTYKKKADKAAKNGKTGRAEADYQELLYGGLLAKYGVDPRMLPPTEAVAEGAADVTLREELQAMRVTLLQKRAQSQGIGEGQIDDAMDSDSPKEALIELIVKQETNLE